MIGLLDLLQPLEQWIPVIDYRKSVEDVYKLVARAIIDESLTLQLFSAVTRTQRNLPSWVPEWSERLEVSSFGLGTNYTTAYNAGGSPAKLIFSSTSKTLFVKGVHFDRVVRVDHRSGSRLSECSDDGWDIKHQEILQGLM